MKRFLLPFFIFVMLGSLTNVGYAQKYRTTWRLFFNPTGASVTAPGHLDARVLEFAFIYKFIGLGTKGFRLYNNANFSSDSVELAGFIAPAYIYIVPLGAHRKALEITPWVMYLYSGFSGWGFKQGMLVDFGIGFTHYFFSFRFGYNAISTESRLFFNVDDPGFHDFPINWRSFYISFDIFPGYWMSLKAKSDTGNNQ